MTDHTHFIGDQQPGPHAQAVTGQQPLGQPAPQPAGRLFFYDGQVFTEPEQGGPYTIRQILEFLADTYPELRHGSWTSRINPEGVEEVTFHKVTGDKGLAPGSAGRIGPP